MMTVIKKKLIIMRSRRALKKRCRFPKTKTPTQRRVSIASEFSRRSRRTSEAMPFSRPGNVTCTSFILSILRSEHHMADMIADPSQLPRRESWYGRLDCGACLIAAVVGSGNLTNFPYLVYHHGGGAYLLAYIVLNCLVGLPVFYLEACLGQMSGLNAIYGWIMTPITKGLGWSILLTSCLMSVLYSTRSVLPLFYFCMSFINPLPWSRCDNSWNTDDCCALKEGSGTPGCDYRYNNSPSEEFYRIQVHESEEVTVYLVACLAFVWLITCLALIRDIYLLTKVMFFNAFIMFMVMMVLILHTYTVNAPSKAIDYFFAVNSTTWLNPELWLDAGLEVCYGILLGTGCIFTLCSYSRYNAGDPFRMAAVVVAVEFLSSFLGCVLLFSHIITLKSDVMTRKITRDTESEKSLTYINNVEALAFVAYPASVSSTNAGPFLSILFFWAFSGLGLTSEMAVVNVVTTFLSDWKQKKWQPRKGRMEKIGLVTVTCCVGFLLSFPFLLPGNTDTTNNGLKLGFTSMLVNTFLEVVAVCWVFGAENFEIELEKMNIVSSRRRTFILACLKYFIPVILLVLLLWSISTLPNVLMQGLGLLLPLACVTAGTVYQLHALPSSDEPLTEKLRELCKSTQEWQQHIHTHRMSRTESTTHSGGGSILSGGLVNRRANDRVDKAAFFSASSTASSLEGAALPHRPERPTSAALCCKKSLTSVQRRSPKGPSPTVKEEEDEEERGSGAASRCSVTSNYTTERYRQDSLVRHMAAYQDSLSQGHSLHTIKSANNSTSHSESPSPGPT